MTECLLPRREVERRTGLSRSAIYERITLGTFPAPIHDDESRRVFWVGSEIDAWVTAKIARARGGQIGGQSKNATLTC